MRVVLAAACLMVMTLAGCAGDSSPDGSALATKIGTTTLPFTLADEVGDASDRQWDALYYAGGCSTLECTPLDAPPQQVAVDAPWLDMTAISVADASGDDVVLEMEIASIGEGFTGLQDWPLGKRIVEYQTCFAPTADGPIRCVTVGATEMAGKIVTEAELVLVQDKCGGYFGVCVWPVEYDIAYGSPATITVSMPKTMLEYDDAPSSIAWMTGKTFWYSTADVGPNWHYAYSSSNEGDYLHDHGGPGWFGDIPDTVALTETDIHYPAATAPWTTPDAAIASGDPGMYWARGPYQQPELDLLETRFWVEDGEVILEHTVASIDTMPLYAAHWDNLIAFSGSSMIEMGIRKDSNTLDAYGYMGRCIGFHCDDVKELRGPVQVTPGSPGKLTVRFPADAFDLGPGRTVNFLTSITMLAEASLVSGEHDDETMVDIHAMSVVDRIGQATPYTIGGVAPLPLVEGVSHDH